MLPNNQHLFCLENYKPQITDKKKPRLKARLSSKAKSSRAWARYSQSDQAKT